MKIPAWLQSSHDPAKVSLTIKGLMVLVPAVVTLAAYFGWHVDPSSLTNVIDDAAVAAGAIATVWGAFRKTWAPDPPQPQPVPPPSTPKTP